MDTTAASQHPPKPEHRTEGPVSNVPARTSLDTPPSGIPNPAAPEHDEHGKRSSPNGSPALQHTVSAYLTSIARTAERMGAFEWDPATRESLLSPELHDIFGTEAADPERLQKWTSRIYPEDSARVQAEMERGFLTGTIEVEYRYRHPERGLRWLYSKGQRFSPGDARILGVVLDVTERRQAQAALRDENQRLKFNLEASSIGTWEWNLLTGEVIWSENVEKILGLEPGSFGGTFESFLERVHEEDRSKIPEAVKQAIEGNGQYQVEYRQLGTNNSVRWMEGKGQVLYDEKHHPIRMMGVCWDITLRKQREDLLRFKANVLARVTDAVLAVDHERRITYWNKAAESLYGLASAEVLGRPIAETLRYRWINPKDERACIRSLTTTGSWQGELIAYKKNGEAFYVETSVTTATGRDPGEGGVLVILRDITERKRAEMSLRLAHDELETRVQERTIELARREEALRSANEELRKQAQLLDLAHDAVIVRDLSSVITFWNRGSERTYGWTRAEALGKVTHILLDTVFPEGHAQVERQLASEGYWEGELTHTRRGGDRITVASRQVLQLDEDGRPTAILEINRDITARKQAEKSLRDLSGRLLSMQDEERRRLARELHDSTAQTLSALSLNLALLEQVKEITQHPRAGKALADSMDLASQASTELRNFSYLLHPPALDEGGLGKALDWYIKGFAARTGIDIKLEMPPETGRLAQELETTLFRVVQEALANIYRHSESAVAGVRLWRDAEGIKLEVWDRGKGLEADIAHRGAEAEAKLGVGIRGMSERVRQLGGRMKLRPGNPGTIVEVLLPPAAAPEKAAAS